MKLALSSLIKLKILGIGMTKYANEIKGNTDFPRLAEPVGLILGMIMMIAGL